MSIEAKATLLALAASLGVLGVTFGLSPFLQPATAAGSQKDQPTKTTSSITNGPFEEQVKQGHILFDRNCAHCHGEDARGDEGPSLYDLSKSDARITRIIKQGIKGEMPTFGKKLNDADVQALIAYLRTLRGRPQS
jgi:mono/diheme cytochrome c family protein